MKKLVFILFLVIILYSCSTKQQIVDCPPCLKEKEYVNVYLPVNSCLLDNITINKPTSLKPFKFSEKSGIITIDDANLKILLYNLSILKTERDMYYNIIESIKK